MHIPKETSEAKGQDEKVQQVFSIKEAEQGWLPKGRGTQDASQGSPCPSTRQQVDLHPLACLSL